MSKKTVLITGAGGYIGSRMVERFLQDGLRVVALDRFFFGDNLNDMASNEQLQIVKDDVRTFNKELLRGVDAVIDLASISNDPASDLNPVLTISINHQGARRVAELAKEMGVKKYILSSSCSIYGASESILTEASPIVPISTYAKTKRAAEEDIIKLGSDNFSVTFLRNGTVYGLAGRRMRFDLIVNIMTLHAWKNNKLFIMGGGKQWRPLVHVDDVINAFRLVMDEPDRTKINQQIFNVGCNEQNYQVYQVANRFRSFFPELVIEETPDDPDRRNYHVNFDKITRVLNFKPAKTVEDGIVEIKEALDRGQITDTLQTRTLDYYKYLINAERILSKIKLNNILF